MNWFNFFNKAQSVANIESVETPVTVVWIHGANQTHLSFEYLRSQCLFKKEYLVNYSSSDGFYNNLNQIIEETQNLGPLFVVGHSLGGLYGLHLTKHVNVVGAVSLSTPFGGSSTADWAKFIVPTYRLFKEVGRRSKPVVDGMKIKLQIPWTQIVSTAGSVPYHGAPNDGVVTIDSMTCRSDMTKIEMPHTHYEVVCSDEVAKIVQQQYSKSVPSHPA
jgi:pimeloyl-ACP methyl ester carboxylesterase